MPWLLPIPNRLLSTEPPPRIDVGGDGAGVTARDGALADPLTLGAPWLEVPYGCCAPEAGPHASRAAPTCAGKGTPLWLERPLPLGGVGP